MKHSKLPWVAFLFLTTLTFGSSRSYVSDLPINDINIVVVTDVHSWVEGHGYHESPDLDAGYGEVLSFYRHLQEICSSEQKDLFFVMNGDFVDGTGLSTERPTQLMEILKKMPWDAVNVGNHELYSRSTIESMLQHDFIPHWEGRYLTSNVKLAATASSHKLRGNNSEPPHLGNPYTFLVGAQQGTRLLTFGFLYDMTSKSSSSNGWEDGDYAYGETPDDSVTVQRVEDAVKEPWFVEVLRGDHGEYDAVVVLSHMDVQDPLVEILRNAIRNLTRHRPTLPIQFVAGHTHTRAFAQLDEYCVSVECGRYLDTVGFLSFNVEGDFDHVFLDANVETLAAAVGFGKDKEQFDTEEGTALTNLIQETQQSMGLLDVVACDLPRSYYRHRTIDDPSSLWALYLEEALPSVLPFYFGTEYTTHVLIHHRTDFRYDLLEGNVRETDLVAVEPLTMTYQRVAQRLPGSTLRALLETLNEEGASASNGNDALLPNYVSSATYVYDDHHYQVYTAGSTLAHKLQNVLEDLVPLSLDTAPVFDGKLDHRLDSITPMSPFTPVAAFNRRTVSQLWKEFVVKRWPCDPEQDDTHIHHTIALVSSSVSLTVKYRKHAGKACRLEGGGTGRDGNEYNLFQHLTHDECKDKCTRAHHDCVAWEFSYNRCEIWYEPPKTFQWKHGFDCYVKVYL